MSYELCALVGRHELVARAASEAGAVAIGLPQGFGLLPVTDEVFDYLGDGAVKPFRDVFWFLSGGVEELARRISLGGAIAYLEADIFGGTGTQAAVAWSGGEVSLGPMLTDYGAFNQALRHLGAERGDAFDEFESLGLGRHRRTEDWAANSTG